MNILLDSTVIGAHHEDIGIIADVIVSQSTHEITHVVIEEKDKLWTKVLPVSCIADSNTDDKVVRLNIHKDAVLFYGDFLREDYLEVDIEEINPGIHPYKGYILTHKPEGESKISRRKFLIIANFAMLLAIIGGLAYPFLRYLIYPMYSGFNNSWYKAINLADISNKPDQPILLKFKKVSKQGYMVTNEEKSHWIIYATPQLINKVFGDSANRTFKELNGTIIWENNISDNIIVYSSKCPHLGCAVRWYDDRQRFISPCHNSIFDIEGKVLSGPAPRRLDTLPVRLDNGQIYIIDAEYKAAISKKERIA